MSIKDFKEEIKAFYRVKKESLYSIKEGLKIGEDVFIVILIILVGTASFGLGKLSSYEKKKAPISIIKGDISKELPKNIDQNATVVNTTMKDEVVFASKSGKRYYYKNCSSTVKEENKIWFSSIKEAEAIGLTLASGCAQ
jgi:hypothetical protein